MDSESKPKSIRSGLLTILLLVAIVGLLAAMAIPNFVGGGPSKTSGISNILRNIDGGKEQWASDHGYSNKVPPSRVISAQDLAPYFWHGDGKDPFDRLGLVIDKDGNLRNPEGVVFVINPLGVLPEAHFSKAFKLSRDRSFIGGLFSPRIPKGTVMRFSTNTNAAESVEYFLPGQESQPGKSLGELLGK